MTEQQPSELLGLFQAMGQQIAGLSTTVGAQGVAKVVKPFGGESSNFKDWIKSIEKYGRLVGMDTASIKLIAYQSSAVWLVTFYAAIFIYTLTMIGIVSKRNCRYGLGKWLTHNMLCYCCEKLNKSQVREDKCMLKG